MAETVSFPGVTLREKDVYGNVYRGSADALIASGLLAEHELPGQPGMGVTMTSFYPNGKRVPQGGGYAWKLPGYRQIRRLGKKGVFEITVQQSEEEREVRRARHWAMWEEEQLQKKLDRALAAPSVPPSPAQRSHLRLVWSAPT